MLQEIVGIEAVLRIAPDGSNLRIVESERGRQAGIDDLLEQYGTPFSKQQFGQNADSLLGAGGNEDLVSRTTNASSFHDRHNVLGERRELRAVLQCSRIGFENACERIAESAPRKELRRRKTTGERQHSGFRNHADELAQERTRTPARDSRSPAFR